MERFIPEFLDYMKDAVTVEKVDDGTLGLKNADATYLIIDQDESIWHSNDVQKM